MENYTQIFYKLSALVLSTEGGWWGDTEWNNGKGVNFYGLRSDQKQTGGSDEEGRLTERLKCFRIIVIVRGDVNLTK